MHFFENETRDFSVSRKIYICCYHTISLSLVKLAVINSNILVFFIELRYNIGIKVQRNDHIVIMKIASVNILQVMGEFIAHKLSCYVHLNIALLMCFFQLKIVF